MRSQREAKGLTQAELAFKAGVSEATVRRLENGRHTPYALTLRAVAGVLEMDVEALSGRAS